MSKEDKIAFLLGDVPGELSVPISFWVGTEAQQYAIRRSVITGKQLSYDALEDAEIKEFAELTGVPIDECVFDRCIYDFIKYGKELPKVNYYLDFKEQWIKSRK